MRARNGFIRGIAALAGTVGWWFAPLAACNPGAAGGGLALKTVADIPLNGDTARWDYESIDPRTHLLFIAHLGDSAVTVFDTRTLTLVAEIRDIGRVHGVLAIPELGRVYASATATGEVAVIDERTLKITARIPAGRYPDGMAYAPHAKKLYVSDQSGAADAVIDVAANTRIAVIPLGGAVGNTQYDPVSGHIFVNVQGRGDLAEIDPASDAVVARYPLPGAKGNHGLLIDPERRLAFIACEDNDRLLAFDMRTMQVVAAFAVGKGPDVLAYDRGLALLYVAAESGVVSLFKIKDRSVEKVGEGFLGPNAHSVAVDTQSHRAYFPLKNLRGHPVLRITEPAP